MPVKYIPYFPNTVEGQAILNNFTRTRRALSYRDNNEVFSKVKRGMPFYEVVSRLKRPSAYWRGILASHKLTPKMRACPWRRDCASILAKSVR